MSLRSDPFALVADDDAFTLMQISEILTAVGFRPLEARSGDEATGILDMSGDTVTLLFTDVEMPGATDGFALARYAAARWPDMEIVVASGRMRPAPGDLPPKATFIGKPFSTKLVQEHLRVKLPDGKKPEPLKAPA